MNELEKLKTQVQAMQIKIERRDRKIKEQEGKIKELQEKIESYEKQIIEETSPEDKQRIFEKQFHSVNWHRKNGFL